MSETSFELSSTFNTSDDHQDVNMTGQHTFEVTDDESDLEPRFIQNAIVSLICQTWNLRTFTVDLKTSFFANQKNLTASQDRRKLEALRRYILQKLDARLPEQAFRLV